MTKLHDLAKLGQAIWYDYIRRSFITSGELAALRDQGLHGLTSNPTIFEKAIAGSTDYDADLHRCVDEGKSVEEIYEVLVFDDIRNAADALRPVYEQTHGGDGFVSLEVSPTLAHDTNGTVTEARRLFKTLGRRNVMIKVPATPAGIPAIETLTSEGINVNITLMFSLAHYVAVAEAYLSGLEKLLAAGGDPSKVSSVASFFVSRVDTAVDSLLEKNGHTDMQGKTAIANAKIAYAKFTETFSGPRWENLARHGARKQRPLWASTGTKNPAYPDTLYVDNLIGADTVNTVPPATLKAFMDHGTVAPTVEASLDEARAVLDQLAALGIDLNAVTDQLQKDAVGLFAKSFEALMTSIADKRDKLLAGWKHQAGQLGAYQTSVDNALAEMAKGNIVARIWNKDHTVWKPDPTEITNRLGWLHIAEVVSDHTHQLEALVEAVRADGYTHALLLGMGGSSLAPEVFRKTFGVGGGGLELAVLDSTDPGAVLAFDAGAGLAPAQQGDGRPHPYDPKRTLYIVSTKSGGTVETFSFFRYFYNRTLAVVGADEVGEHFIAITDPGSGLADVAAKYNFRATFLNDPNIGGRYSALSYFGIVPAALVGVDIHQLLDRAMRAASGCASSVAPADNPGAWLGAVLGECAKAGRDKVTFVLSPALARFGDWVEQLIAESTGKEGKGILPVVGETLAAPSAYANDRLFVHIELESDRDPTGLQNLSGLEAAGHPVVRVRIHDTYDLGMLFFVWEFATAVAGYRLGINPFDQPNVESAKVLARQMVAAYQKEGKLPTSTAEKVAGDTLKAFLARAVAGNGAPRAYVALQAYVQPTPQTSDALQALRTTIQTTQRLATTVGYGPRFLHSTGQLHKGDAGNGLFIQFVADMPRDAAIPDEAGSASSAMTFGVLKTAQVLGDAQALQNAGRRVIRFDLGSDPVGALRKLSEQLSVISKQ